jgi:hypothetical protein
MAGEAEVNEPLAVEPSGHLLQDLDASLAVLDQVVVGGQDAGDAALDGEWGNADFHCVEMVAIYSGDRSRSIVRTKAQGAQEQGNKIWVIPFEILYV